LKGLRGGGIDTGVVGFEDGKWVEVEEGDKVACFGETNRVCF
jgi:hypothetical protein